MKQLFQQSLRHGQGSERCGFGTERTGQQKHIEAIGLFRTCWARRRRPLSPRTAASADRRWNTRPQRADCYWCRQNTRSGAPSRHAASHRNAPAHALIKGIEICRNKSDANLRQKAHFSSEKFHRSNVKTFKIKCAHL